jgi:transposase
MEHPGKPFLEPPERDSLKALHRPERDKRICDRIKAMLLLDKGWAYREVSEALLLDEDTIRRYYKTYTEGGIESLSTLHYSGRLAKLEKSQLDDLEAYVKETVPSTAQEVLEYIRQKFNITYSESAVILLLHKLEFVYKKPKLVPGKADREKQQQFLSELEELKGSLEENDKIFYMDGVHPQHNSKPAYGWMKKGKDTILKSNTGRQRININGALDPDTLEVSIQVDTAVNAQSTIQLFNQLEAKNNAANRIIIICDNARYYRSNLVKEYLKQSRIEIKFLPPYAPNLNLIERLWRFMNKKIRNNKYYEKFDAFRAAVFGFFEKIDSYQSELASLLTQKFHIINS